MGDAEIRQAASDLGRKVHQGCIDHISAIGSAHDGYTGGDEFILHIPVDVIQESPDILDRIFAFEHIVHGTVAFPVSSTSTDIRVYNGAAKLIQEISMDESSHISTSAQQRNQKTGHGHPRLGSTLALRSAVDVDYHRYRGLSLLRVVVHARHLQPIETLEPEQLRRVHVEPGWARRGLPIRPRDDRDKRVPLLVPLVFRAFLESKGEVDECEEAVARVGISACET